VHGGLEGASVSRLLKQGLASPGALPAGDLRVLCAGKAAAALASTVAELYGPRIRSCLVVGVAPSTLPDQFESIAGSHPVPTEESERAGRRALALAASLVEGETLLVLLSGGASAMMAVPAEGITLDDKRVTTSRLLKAGADIHALNTVRKHISGIKGGWLAARAPGASRTFAISDVVGDDLSVIASGPTVGDGTTFSDAIGVLQRFGAVSDYPRSVVARLMAGQRGELPETPKPDDSRLLGAMSTVIGSRRDAMAGAVAEAESRGYHVWCIDEPVVGESRSASQSHLQTVMTRAAHLARPTCIVSSGETTVHVTGHGKGGRNQEFALAMAATLATMGAPIVVASAGTDGIDGPTDAAGAVADPTTIARAQGAGIGDPDRYLGDNDAYAFFDAIGDLIRTGPTNTNVGDLQVVLIAE
jgi:glycerate 2-kinase